MKRTIMTTGDGSKTIHMPDLNEQYHSKHGALQEALHVFIETGLAHFIDTSQVDKDYPINILEYGLGTGLNAMLTLQFQEVFKIHYTGVEAFPVSHEEVAAMDYGNLLNEVAIYNKIHEVTWEQNHKITSHFSLLKKQMEFEKLVGENLYDIIYFDAFGPRTQPELWNVDIFAKAYLSMKKRGVLVTYCAQGQARRNMQESGFIVERLPGPPGKREMLRATKN
jgi:tRNA U34 5-methylaminomethyl-2-thiouridine-forming methyltransferase MnmC